jgi:hypothetical protein
LGDDLVGSVFIAVTPRRRSAAVTNPAECQVPVTIESVPAQISELEPFASYGLYGIPEDRFHVSDFYPHARPESPKRPVRP